MKRGLIMKALCSFLVTVIAVCICMVTVPAKAVTYPYIEVKTNPAESGMYEIDGAASYKRAHVYLHATFMYQHIYVTGIEVPSHIWYRISYDGEVQSLNRANYTSTSYDFWLNMCDPGEYKVEFMYDIPSVSGTTVTYSVTDASQFEPMAEYTLVACHINHTPADEYTVDLEPTCGAPGSRSRHCTRARCNAIIEETVEEIPPTGNHTPEEDSAVAPTCTQTGLTAGSHCSVCQTVLVAQNVVPASGHTSVTDHAVAPTCTQTGLTAGSHCSVCHTVLVAQSVVPAAGHTPVPDPAVAPTATTTGLTAGSHCSVCGEVLVAQTVIPLLSPSSPSDPSGSPDNGSGQPVPQPGENTDGNPPVIPSPAADSVSFIVNAIDHTATVSGAASADAAEVIIPDTFPGENGETYNVTGIAENAFTDNKNLKKITIGKNVLAVGMNAFSGCSNLEKVSGGNNVLVIGKRAFFGCTKLKTVPAFSKLVTIFDGAFQKCTSLTTFTIGKKVTMIGRNAFSGCSKLKKLIVKATKLVKDSVGKNAFRNISKKATVKVPRKLLNRYREIFLKPGGAPKTVKFTK